MFCAEVRRGTSLRKGNEQHVTEIFFKKLRQEVAILLWETKFHAVVRTTHTEPYFTQFHPVKIFPSHLLKIRFNIILLSTHLSHIYPILWMFSD
jgi:hypothetical protein